MMSKDVMHMMRQMSTVLMACSPSSLNSVLCEGSVLMTADLLDSKAAQDCGTPAGWRRLGPRHTVDLQAHAEFASIAALKATCQTPYVTVHSHPCMGPWGNGDVAGTLNAMIA